MRMIAPTLLAVWITGCGRSGPGSPTAMTGSVPTVVTNVAAQRLTSTEPPRPTRISSPRPTDVATPPPSASIDTPAANTRQSGVRYFPVPALPPDVLASSPAPGSPIQPGPADGYLGSAISTDEDVAIRWVVEFFTYRADEPSETRRGRLSMLTNDAALAGRLPGRADETVLAMWPIDARGIQGAPGVATVEAAIDQTSTIDAGTTSQTLRCAIEVVDGRVVRFVVLP